MRLVIVNWKKLLTEAAFWRFCKSQSLCFNQKFICICSIYNPCEFFRLYCSRNRQLVKIYLLSNNFTKFFIEGVTIMITFSVCMAFFAYWTLLTHIYQTQCCFFTASIILLLLLSTLCSIMQQNILCIWLASLRKNVMLKVLLSFNIFVEVME